MPRLVLFNTGWMRDYRGQTPTDKLVNGGEYVRENEDGGEVRNFLPRRGRVYAYVRTPGGGPLDLRRVGADAGDEHLDGATVVFTATRPEGGRVVTGWYDDARVTRDLRDGGFASTAEANATLLPPDDRVFPVPRARDGAWGMGQSNVRYVDEPEAAPFVRELRRYIADPTKPLTSSSSPARSGSPRSVDPLRRGKIEVAAIERVVAHYQKLGFNCLSVEKDNVGWDLEATRGGVTLLVEVKGCSGPAATVELTPNEYRQMRGPRRASYRLAIVTRALEREASQLAILSYNPVVRTWCDEAGRRANITAIEAARFSAPE